MWFTLLDDDTIMMNTKRGRLKDRNLLRDRRVSLCVENGYRFVTIAGEVELIEDQEQAQADIKALATRYYGVERAERQVLAQYRHEERITLLLPLSDALVYEYEDE